MRLRNWLGAAVFFATAAIAAPHAGSPGAAWSFAVSGDSRNCGDVVMPAIAAGAQKDGAAFYWHLGDLRAIYTFDEDFLHEPAQRTRPPTILNYEDRAWDDFIEHQVGPFGPMPFFLGIGNHETISPKTRDEFLIQFADWLDEPVLRDERLKDNPRDRRLHAYYHWIQGGVDFFNLDNASPDQFDAAQMRWFEGTLARDASDPAVTTFVIGMHRALPDSISLSHSMNESAEMTESGRAAYEALLKLQNDGHKRVYLLASHSHFYMDGIFNTEYIRAHGGILPGWIVGTAGAVRYPLPEGSKDARAAETNVYGYLLGTVKPGGEIEFAYRKLSESDVPGAVALEFTPEFVHWCFTENSYAPR